MTEAHSSYSTRRRIIAEKLDPAIGTLSMVPTNTMSGFEPGVFEHSLVCSWADPETLTSRTVSVFINAVADGEQKATDLREMIDEETLPTPDAPPEDAEAFELSVPNPAEFVFALNYLGQLTAIAGNCVVHILPYPVSMPLTELADVALDIARTVGCSSYVDDFEPPAIDGRKIPGAWSTADGLVYDPRTPPAE